MKWLPDRNYVRDNVAFRNDTLLGVCEALGRDLGFNPNFLRIPLASGIIFAPFVMVGVYLALGAVVFAIRTLSPDRFEQRPAAAAAAAAPAGPAYADNHDIELPRAA